MNGASSMRSTTPRRAAAARGALRGAAFAAALPLALGAAAQAHAQTAPAATPAEAAAAFATPTSPAAAPQAAGGAAAVAPAPQSGAATVDSAAPAAAPPVAPPAIAAAAPTEPQPIPPVQAALMAAAVAAGDEAVAQVYAAHGWAPLWLGDRPERVAQGLLAAFEGAESHGLPPVVDAADLRARLDDLRGAVDPEQRAVKTAALDVALSLAAARYGTALASGALTPRKVDAEIHVDPPRPDVVAMLTAIADAPEPRRALDAMAPADPGYEALRARLAAFRALAASGGWQAPTPDVRVLRPGDRGPAVAEMRRRLIELGDAEAAAPVKVAAAGQASDSHAAAAEALFDPALEEAVRRFQRRHGLNDDGVAGARTFDAMAESAATRMRQIAVNLERMRWMNRDLGDRRIVVNLADYRMQVVLGGQVVQDMRVVVGEAKKHRTPEFSDVMTHMVVNPTWNVPYSIATKEILPKLREDPTYLAGQNMSLRRDGAVVDPLTVDWFAYSRGNFPFRIRQEPGEDNALGQVKFMFPNNFAIYLHDTPSRRLFAKDMRAASHGCVRVERPIDLALQLLDGQVEDPAERFAAWQARGEEIWVTIRNPLQVHLMYRTAWVDPQTGEDEFRADVYGRDTEVWNALSARGLAL